MKNKGLVGKWFHSFYDWQSEVEGELNWQGHILSKEEDMYLIQLFSWIDGEPTDQKLISVKEMKDWKFYDSNKDMLLAGEKLDKKKELPEGKVVMK